MKEKEIKPKTITVESKEPTEFKELREYISNMKFEASVDRKIEIKGGAQFLEHMDKLSQ